MEQSPSYFDQFNCQELKDMLRDYATQYREQLDVIRGGRKRQQATVY